MHIKHETNFVVMPDMCNYMNGMIFGGSFFSQMDLAAATLVSRALHQSECNEAVTHKVNDLVFHDACYCGDIVFLKCEITEVRHKAIVVHVKAYREKRAVVGQKLVATANFVFVTKLNGAFKHHGLKEAFDKEREQAECAFNTK